MPVMFIVAASTPPPFPPTKKSFSCGLDRVTVISSISVVPKPLSLCYYS